MFMNNTSMSQTCCIKFPTQKAARFVQQTVAIEGIWL